MKLLQPDGDVVQHPQDPHRVERSGGVQRGSDVALGLLEDLVVDGVRSAGNVHLAAGERAHDPVHPLRAAEIEHVLLEEEGVDHRLKHARRVLRPECSRVIERLQERCPWSG